MKEKHFQDEEIPDNIIEEKIYQNQNNIGLVDSSVKDSELLKNNYQERYEQLANIFEDSRQYWTKKILEHSQNFKDIEKIIELQVELFSDRQIILEQKHKLYERVSKMNNDISRDKRSKYLEYSINYDLRLNKDEKNIFIEADLANKSDLINLIDNHINYLDQTIKTLDNIIFGIKYRISLYEMLDK